MLETNTKKWEKAVFERGVEQRIEKKERELVEKMIENGLSTSDIRKITGLPISRIEQMRRKRKRR